MRYIRDRICFGGKERKVQESRSKMKVAVDCSSPQTNNLGLAFWWGERERDWKKVELGKNGL